MCAFAVCWAAIVPVGAQEGPGAATTTTEPTAPAPSTTAPTASTTAPADPYSGGPADPGDGFTIPEAPEREVPPEEAPPPQRPDRGSLIPPPIDLDSLNAVLESRRAEATAGARLLADAATAESLRAAESRQIELSGLQDQLAPLEARVESAREAERIAVSELERARNRFADIAAEAYTLASTGGGALAKASVDVIEGPEGFENLLRTSEYSGAAWRSLGTSVGEREAELVTAETSTAAEIAALADLSSRISAAQAAFDLAAAETAQTVRDGEELVAAAAAIGDDLSVDGLGPTILGETILGPEDMATFSALRPNAPPYERLLELAEYFVAEGESEGVRGDIAWAQSILETGNFGYRGSMVSTSDNNFAGIGACDSCSSGFRYDTAQLGVRAQMQLLRAYADDNLTSDQLGNPPVGRPPERVGVRGCCDTWMELSGVWATGPGYGVKILTLYNDMLAHAARRQAAGLR